MERIKWELLDADWFVYFISDLLTARGYAARYQGDGPDGGVDLFATQTISFAFDTQPFTWAVQCKFSKKPKKAVSDSEIRDVEGILRSSRYQVLKPKGYMLVTNRHITQNVIERLRGINDQTRFRTCSVDGMRLTSLVHAHNELLSKYFAEPVKDLPKSISDNILADIEEAVGRFMSAYR